MTTPPNGRAVYIFMYARLKCVSYFWFLLVSLTMVSLIVFYHQSNESSSFFFFNLCVQTNKKEYVYTLILFENYVKMS